MMRDVNGWFMHRVRGDITVRRVPDKNENENGRKVVEFCAEKGLCCR